MLDKIKGHLPSKKDFIVSLVLFFGFAIAAGTFFQIIKAVF